MCDAEVQVLRYRDTFGYGRWTLTWYNGNGEGEGMDILLVVIPLAVGIVVGFISDRLIVSWTRKKVDQSIAEVWKAVDLERIRLEFHDPSNMEVLDSRLTWEARKGEEKPKFHDQCIEELDPEIIGESRPRKEG